MRLTLALALSLSSALPALAAETPTATKSDSRVRMIFYKPNEPIELPGAVGATLEIQLEPGEKVLGVPTSDEGLIEGGSGSDRLQPNPSSSADGNIAVAVVGSDILIKPLRHLTVQPLFVIGQKGDTIRHYTFELRTADTPSPRSNTSDKVASNDNTVPATPLSYWVVHMLYPAQPQRQQSVEDLSQKEQARLARGIKAPDIKNLNYTIRGSVQ